MLCSRSICYSGRYARSACVRLVHSLRHTSVAHSTSSNLYTYALSAQCSPQTLKYYKNRNAVFRHYAVSGPEKLQGASPQSTSPNAEAILLSGFSADQAAVLHSAMQEMVSESPFRIVPLSATVLKHTIDSLLDMPDLPSSDSQGSPYGRVVLITGPALAPYAAHINDLLLHLGQAPAIVAARQPSHDGQATGEVLRQLREAHLQYFELFRPLQQVEGVRVPEEAQVVMNVELDAGRVPTPEGGLRDDVSRLVVLDGVCSEAERAGLLAWLTAPDHDHGGPPPEERWELSCVDRTGDQPTWGLRPEVLHALQHDPPPALVSLQSRLAALYPEYHICHMPSDAFEDPSLPPPDEDDEQGVAMLSPFVGNAVLPGDPCQWHVDADPSVLPGESPWVQHFGWYVNREAGRPLFVTMLVYLNEEWRDEWDAETLFLDPATQGGVFVRPAPGRIIMMDQDVTHRISAPSRQAPGPRYSLVWKVVMFPKPEAGSRPSLARPEWGPPQRFGTAAGSVPAVVSSRS